MKNDPFNVKCNLYVPELNDTQAIVGVEIKGLKLSEDEGYDEIEKGEKAHVWSVYIRLKLKRNDFSPAICIADFSKKKYAKKFAKTLKRIIKVLK